MFVLIDGRRSVFEMSCFGSIIVALPADRISHGAVAELADALDLGSSLFGGAGSIPVGPI